MRINHVRLKEEMFLEGRKMLEFPHQKPTFKKLKLARVNHAAVCKSLRFIGENYLQPIQVTDLARVCGMTRRGFIDAFCRHMGLPPASFIRKLRIEQAAQFLIEHDWPLKTVAERSGFRSDNTFCIAFNRATGLSPKKFQRQVWLSTLRSSWLTKAA